MFGSLSVVHTELLESTTIIHMTLRNYFDLIIRVY